MRVEAAQARSASSRPAGGVARTPIVALAGAQGAILGCAEATRAQAADKAE